MSRLQTTRTVPVIGALLLAIPCYAPAGGQLETVDVTAAESSFPPYVDGDLIPIQWDARCVPVHYTLRDANLDQVAGGAPAVESAIVAAMKSWNDIPTSYIEFVFDGTDSKAPTPGNFGAFDLVNEIHFNAMGPFLGASPSIALAVDTTMTLTTDLNGDGTPDTFDPAVAGRGDCHDVDGDGDIEFPIGDYKAGTILDNDTLYASPARVNWAQDFFPPFVDLEGVIVHELGHSHGLSHSFINQQNIFSVDDGPFDGTSVTMFPFVDTGDPLDQLSSRSLALDDVAWSSLVYPEGSGASGPAALGPDDIDFDDVFGIISGTITHGKQDMPLAGAHVTALRGSIDQGDESNVDTRDVGPENSSNTEWLPMPHIVGGFSGTTRVGVTASEGLPSDVSAGLALVGPQSFHIVDGNYRIPAPKGPHKVIVEPVDGLPAGAGSISVTAILGDIFDQLDFNEGFVVKPNGKRRIVHVTAGNETDGIDHTTDTTQVNVGAGSIRFAGSIVAPPNRVYAVAIPGSELTAW